MDDHGQITGWRKANTPKTSVWETSNRMWIVMPCNLLVGDYQHFGGTPPQPLEQTQLNSFSHL